MSDKQKGQAKFRNMRQANDHVISKQHKLDKAKEVNIKKVKTLIKHPQSNLGITTNTMLQQDFAQCVCQSELYKESSMTVQRVSVISNSD